MVTATAPAEHAAGRRSAEVAGRALLVTSLGGVAIGAASGSLTGPVLGPVVGAGVGLAVGATTGVVTAAAAAMVVRRRPKPSARAARLVFLLPTACVAVLSVAVSGVLLVAAARTGTWSGGDVAAAVAFGLTGPLALLLVVFAAPWCLSPAMPQLHRPHAGRRLLLAAALVAVLALGTVTWGFFRV